MAKVIKRESSAVHRIGTPRPRGEGDSRRSEPEEAEATPPPPRQRRASARSSASKSSAGKLSAGKSSASRSSSSKSASSKSSPAAGEARAIVAKAQRDARELSERVAQEVAASIEEARQRGQETGFSDTRDLNAKMEELAAALQHEVEPEALKSSMMMARRFMDKELDKHSEVIVDIVRQALMAVKQQREVFVRVHPDHVEVLRKFEREIVDVLGRAKGVDIREDPDLDQGGCMVETEMGAIDARLETQFEVLARNLTSGSK